MKAIPKSKVDIEFLMQKCSITLGLGETYPDAWCIQVLAKYIKHSVFAKYITKK